MYEEWKDAKRFVFFFNAFSSIKFAYDPIQLQLTNRESTRTLRSTAAMLLGARPGASITLYLATQPDPFYDPIFDATLPIVIKYANMIWMARDRPGMMERAWRELDKQLNGKPSWAGSRGPMSATWLSLARVGWRMTSCHAIVTDKGQHLSMLLMAPLDVRELLIQGIRRWQGRKICSHFDIIDENHGELNMEVVREVFVGRAAISSKQGAGDLRALWSASAWPMARKYEAQ